MPPRKSPNRFVVRIDPENQRALKEREMVFERPDGRLEGISRAVNKSIAGYLRRI